MSECINCGSLDTWLERADDGHFRKYCNDCDYVGGPYISERKTDPQTKIDDF